MRIIRLFLAALLFVPFFSNAQERQFDETVLILHATDSVPYENLADGCYWAIPFLPAEVTGGFTMDLRAVKTKKKSGEATKSSEKIGEIWQCYSDDVMVDSPLGPRYETPIAFAITLGDKVYGALDLLNNKVFGWPEEGSGIWGTSAALVHVIDDQPGDLAGTMTLNISNRPLDGHLTLRLFSPRDFELEAVAEALKTLGF